MTSKQLAQGYTECQWQGQDSRPVLSTPLITKSLQLPQARTMELPASCSRPDVPESQGLGPLKTSPGVRSPLLPQPGVSAEVVGSPAHRDESPCAEHSIFADKGQASLRVSPPGGGQVGAPGAGAEAAAQSRVVRMQMRGSPQPCLHQGHPGQLGVEVTEAA